LQDFKVGYILGARPRSIQIVELIAVIAASLVMYFPLMVLDRGMGGFGSAKLPAPQAGLMAYLAQALWAGKWLAAGDGGRADGLRAGAGGG